MADDASETSDSKFPISSSRAAGVTGRSVINIMVYGISRASHELDAAKIRPGRVTKFSVVLRSGTKLVQQLPKNALCVLRRCEDQVLAASDPTVLRAQLRADRGRDRRRDDIRTDSVLLYPQAHDSEALQFWAFRRWVSRRVRPGCGQGARVSHCWRYSGGHGEVAPNALLSAVATLM